MKTEKTTDFKALKEFMNKLNLTIDKNTNRGVRINGGYNNIHLTPESLMRLSYDLTALALGETP